MFRMVAMRCLWKPFVIPEGQLARQTCEPGISGFRFSRFARTAHNALGLSGQRHREDGKNSLCANPQTRRCPTVRESEPGNSEHPETTGYETLLPDLPALKALNRA